MPKTPFALPPEAKRPLYAAAGATDLAVELARGYVTEAQKRTQDRVRAIDLDPQSLQAKATDRAKARQARFEQTLADLREQAAALPSGVSAKVESYLNGIVAELETAYADLASRGEKVVGRIRSQQATVDAEAAVKTATSRAKATGTTATKAAKATTSRAKATRTTAAKGAKTTKSSAKATGTTAKKAAGKTAKAAGDAARKVGD